MILSVAIWSHSRDPASQFKRGCMLPGVILRDRLIINITILRYLMALTSRFDGLTFFEAVLSDLRYRNFASSDILYGGMEPLARSIATISARLCAFGNCLITDIAILRHLIALMSQLDGMILSMAMWSHSRNPASQFQRGCMLLGVILRGRLITNNTILRYLMALISGFDG